MIKRLKAYLAAYFAKVADPCETQLQEPYEAVAKPVEVDNYKALLQSKVRSV